MKKQIKLLIGIIAFVALFYQAQPAINASLFALLVLGMLLLHHKIRDKKIKWLAAGVILSSLSFAWYGDIYSFGALFFSLLVIGIHGPYRNLNILLYPVVGLVNLFTFPFRIFFFKYWLPQGKLKALWKKQMIIGLVPVILVSIFIGIYTTGSDHFAHFFLRFSFDFNFFEILFLTCLGFFLMFNYWFMYIPREVLKFNQNIADHFSPLEEEATRSVFTFLDDHSERRSGEISLILLNILLLVFIITYNYEQFFITSQRASLSDEVHQRVTTIIGSIVLAIGVIMFYFRSAFSFDVKAGPLKALATTWILLNALLICSAIAKNSEYILSYGLTFKRISVFIFLALSLVGLYLTYFKLKNKKTNGFLVNRMTWILFITFIVLSPVNFSWLVTRYNITFHKNDDIVYLQSLDYNKQLLRNTYQNDPVWANYLEAENKRIQEEKREQWRSARLYYQFLKW
jgi:hypothetical protein